jgi:prepilin-type N-terminal cleavage/methylation domain-containing protein/prepilin-type processing-associated H-X9-DG protein
MLHRAFTLIELLVVIAIIAILAAILFPVFAQAKAAAKKSVSLSNVKQIGTGMHLYLADSDDVTPSTWVDGATGKSVDIYQTLQPYLKNMDVFFSPVWENRVAGSTTCDNTNTPAGNYVPTGINKDRCLGYGYNWGFGVWAGGALVGPNVKTPDGGTVLPGVSATGAEDPARLAAFGDTYNGRRYTISAVGSLLTHYAGAQKNSELRHGGKLNFNYLDGHAKSLSMAGFTYNPAANPKGTGYIAMPSDPSLWVPMYCLSTGGTVDAGQLLGNGNGNAPQMLMSCQQLITAAMGGALTGGVKPAPWPN